MIQAPTPPVNPVIVQGPPPGVDPNIILNQVEDLVVIVASVVAVIVVAVFLKPLVMALARRLEGKAGVGDLRGELDQLRDQVAEMDHLRARLIELEERVEFAERLLAQQHPRAALGGGEG